MRNLSNFEFARLFWVHSAFVLVIATILLQSGKILHNEDFAVIGQFGILLAIGGSAYGGFFHLAGPKYQLTPKSGWGFLFLFLAGICGTTSGNTNGNWPIIWSIVGLILIGLAFPMFSKPSH